MALTASDITRDAELFRAAYPHWPHTGPEITATSPAVLDDEGEQIAREERWT